MTPNRFTLLPILSGLLLGILLAPPARSQEVPPAETVMVSMPDGIRLATDIYLPAPAGGAHGKHPAVLVRTPYSAAERSWLGEGLASRGFAVVLQDVRGQGRSEGQFFPFVNEQSDGLATMDWLVEQPWSDGRILLWGASYYGYGAFELARTGHPAVAGVFHISGWSDLGEFMAHGGAFQLQAHLYWYYAYASGQPPPPAEAWTSIFRTLPLWSFLRGAEAVFDLAALPYDYDDIGVPVMHVTGWYDYIYPNVLQTWAGLAAASRPPAQRLIVGPWSHNGVLAGWTRVGEEEFGEGARAGTDWAMDHAARWYRYALSGDEGELAGEAAVRYFVLRDNRWMEDSTWPPSGTEYQRWYASPDGALSLSAPSAAGSLEFVYDPEDPVPTLGGANSHFFPENLGAKDQSALAARPDVLTFTSEPFSEGVTLAGPVTAVVYAATTGRDTDFTAKLSVVQTDGFVRNIEDGIVRARHLFAGSDSTGYVVPGNVYRYDVDCGGTAIAIRAGERLRLQVSSSNFPKYDRNPNSGIDPIVATALERAIQTVHFSPDHPTHVVVPVLR